MASATSAPRARTQSVFRQQKSQKLKKEIQTVWRESERMASPTEPISHFLQSATSNLLSLFTPSPKTSSSSSSSLTTSKICVPLLHPIPNYSPFDSNPKSSSIKTVQSPTSNSNSPFPSTVRINSLNSNGKAGGPAFVGQVFSMCDLSGTGLMAVSTHFDIPFLSKRYTSLLLLLIIIIIYFKLQS